MEFIAILLANLIWGIAAMAIGKAKGINGFFYGFCLGFIGLIIVICMKEKEPIKNEDPNTFNSNIDKYSSLEKLNELKNSGALSEEEYNLEKNKIMNL